MGRVFLNGHAVLLNGKHVSDVCPQSRLPGRVHRTISLGGRVLAPGFIDLQVNGGGRRTFCERTQRSIHCAGCRAAHRLYGTVACFPTLLSMNDRTMRSAVGAVRAAMREGIPGILGIHFEGPHISRKRAGAHDACVLRELDENGLRRHRIA